ncbi:hypothetical protein [Mucilaginibacter sp.]|uniref:hypothetical protein n=1 Tax=Mucilaginibacter sp. TaxID=1882438 RepID=UPI0032672943
MKKIYLLLSVLIMIMCENARSQYKLSHGSLVIGISNKDDLVITADKRTSTDCQFTDTDTKLFKIDKYNAFSITGNGQIVTNKNLSFLSDIIISDYYKTHVVDYSIDSLRLLCRRLNAEAKAFWINNEALTYLLNNLKFTCVFYSYNKLDERFEIYGLQLFYKLVNGQPGFDIKMQTEKGPKNLFFASGELVIIDDVAQNNKTDLSKEVSNFLKEATVNKKLLETARIKLISYGKQIVAATSSKLETMGPCLNTVSIITDTAVINKEQGFIWL